MDNGTRQPHIVFFPSAGMGHLFPISQLAKLLVDRHHFTITIITFSEYSNKTQHDFLSSLPSSITSLSLPPIPLSDLPENSAIETRMSIAAARSVPHLRSLLLPLLSSTRLVAFIADLFTTSGCDAAKSLKIPHFIFIPTNLLFLTLMFHLPALNDTLSCDFGELEDPVLLPGFPPIPGTEILHPLQDRKNECFQWMLQHAKRYREAEGILVNTFDAIEPEAAKLLKKDEEPGRATVYTVGPLVRAHAVSEDAQCLKWLDSQPIGSVLFVSFGSVGSHSIEQLGELALGLEASGQRFLWVVRSPIDLKSAGSNYIEAGQSADNPFAYLPEGFLERTKGVGLVVPSWAPQVEVLAHSSTGGFLSHCGWNSTLESMARGVPMIVWPLFAEQRMNAVMMVEGAKVAMRLKERKDGIFDREEIRRVVKDLMQGKKGERLRKRAKELQVEAEAAMTEGGSSSVSLAAFAEKLKSFQTV